MGRDTDEPIRPRHDAPRAVVVPVQRPAAHAHPWRWLAAGGCGGALLVVLLLGWPLALALDATLRANAGLLEWLFRLLAVTITLAVIGALAAGTRWLHIRAERAGVLWMQNDQPIHLDDLRHASPALLAHALDRHYEVQITRAAQSGMANLASLHLSTRAGAAPAPTSDAAPAPTAALPTALALPARTPAQSLLAQLQERGQLSATPWQLLAGFDDHGPHAMPLAQTSFIAVAGQPRTGKTATAMWLAAQAALHGWHVAICDPHGHQPDGLLQRCAPFSGHTIRQAITHNEIIATIALVDKIGQRRLAGDKADRPLLLLIDEFTTLVLRDALPDATLAQLTAMALEYAKVHVHGIVIGQDWTHQLVGTQFGAPLRRAITHRILHRCDAQNAEFLLPDPALARQTMALPQGAAMFWNGGVSTTVQVPLLDADDLRYAARGVAPRPYAPRPPLSVTLSARPLQPPPAPTLDARILALLASADDELDARAIARALDAEITSVRNVLTELSEQARVARAGNARSYRYRAVSSASGGDAAAPAGTITG